MKKSCLLLSGFMEVDIRLEVGISSIRFQSIGCRGVKSILLLESSKSVLIPLHRGIEMIKVRLIIMKQLSTQYSWISQCGWSQLVRVEFRVLGSEAGH